MNVERTIFIAEDNPADVYLIREALKGLTLPLQIVSDGEEAIALIERIDSDLALGCPAAALLDINLPKRNGGEVLARFRSSPRCGTAPALIITSSDSPRERSDLLKLGATRYFRKPSSLDDFMELGRVVRELLGVKAEEAG